MPEKNLTGFSQVLPSLVMGLRIKAFLEGEKPSKNEKKAA